MPSPNRGTGAAQLKRQAMLRGSSINLTKAVIIALAIALHTSVATAAEEVWPKNSASDVSIFVTILRFRIYADHCSAKVPRLKPKFESLMEDMNSRIQGISNGLLASEEFMGMKDKPVPVEIIDALKDSFDDLKHNFERLDAASICPETLQAFSEMDNESLISGLKVNLTGVQSMIQRMEKASAR